MIEESSKSARRTYEQDDAVRVNPTKVMRTLPDIIRTDTGVGDAVPRFLSRYGVGQKGQEERELVFEKIVEKYGEPYHCTRNEVGRVKAVKVNERHFAARLVSEADIVHDPLDGFFGYEAKTGLWQPQTSDRLQQHIADIIREQANFDGCKQLELQICDRLQKAVVSQVRGISEQVNFFSQKPDCVHVANGVLVQECGELVFKEWGFSREYRSRNRCEIVYEPTAKCPRTDNELVLMNLSEEDAKVYWQYVGLCLFGKNFPRRILVIHGLTSGTGKSVMVNLARKLVGGANCVELRTQHLESRFEMDRFMGKTLLLGPDVNADFLSNAGAQALLRLTGGDLITPETKIEKAKFARSMEGRFCVMISSNNFLHVRDGSAMDPWRNRLILLEALGNVPKTKIPDFADVLINEEGPGILNRAVDGLKSLLKEADAFNLSVTQKRRVELLLNSSSSARIFIEECVEKAAGASLTTSELEAAYFVYCGEMNMQPREKAGQAIASSVRDLFCLNEHHSLYRNGKSQRGFRGLQFKPCKMELLGQKGQLFSVS